MMRSPFARLVIVLLCLSFAPLAAIAQDAGAGEKLPQVIAPTEAIFEKFREADRDVARKFYKKYIDVKGLAVIASGDVADEALQRTYWIVTHMLAGRPDILEAMGKAGTRLLGERPATNAEQVAQATNAAVLTFLDAHVSADPKAREVLNSDALARTIPDKVRYEHK